MNNLDTITTRVTNEIEEQCGIKNGAFILLIILSMIDTKEWKADRSIVANLYTAIEIVEKAEDLKDAFNTNDTSVNSQSNT